MPLLQAGGEHCIERCIKHCGCIGGYAKCIQARSKQARSKQSRSKQTRGKHLQICKHTSEAAPGENAWGDHLGRAAWGDRLGEPAGGTAWRCSLEIPPGMTAWEDHLGDGLRDETVGFTKFLMAWNPKLSKNHLFHNVFGCFEPEDVPKPLFFIKFLVIQNPKNVQKPLVS